MGSIIKQTHKFSDILQASGFKNREDEDSYDVDGTSLFRVRGTCPEDVMTTQIQPECVSLICFRIK